MSTDPHLPSPPREPSALPPRVVYGYVRVIRGDTDRAAALKADLMAFCRTYGYMLGTVFTDWGVDDTTLARPGFASLVDVCKLVGSHGVVVPARSHLSSHDDTLSVLKRQIQRTGVQLVCVDEVTALGPPSAAREDHGADTEQDDAPC
ncbi:recombinase family protein [Kibdelosporangium philippinense]|uniref:Recombinase family protein n=1 Tax=Kibdelosporangium philippinense TaxID=211113 RepID=A0ABS8ZJD5_9PSEU|nr:recombinase family protein [Kibdelosporangium philippinense]MCE7006588.1 recombinase family protein [Kibdelosporangium philippinense]